MWAGLGLAIGERLVEMMDGEIEVVSEVGRGSTISFTGRLPGTIEPADRPAPMLAAAHSARTKARILVVDDIATNREIIDAYINVADALGLDALVEACRNAAKVEPADNAGAEESLADLRRAQSKARQALPRLSPIKRDAHRDVHI